MLYIAIVDDEKECINTLKNYLCIYFEEKKQPYKLFEFTNGTDFLEKYKPIYDLVFMDIEMPYMDGLTISRRFREIDDKTMLIFVTRMAQFAVSGYEVSAYDYILKPVDYNSFALKLSRALPRIQKNIARVSVTCNGKVKLLSAEDIMYIEVFTHKLIYHTLEGDYDGKGPLSGVFKLLQPYGFAVIHRCYIVNMRYVSSVEGDFCLIGKTSLKIGRSNKKQFMKSLAEFYNISF